MLCLLACEDVSASVSVSSSCACFCFCFCIVLCMSVSVSVSFFLFMSRVSPVCVLFSFDFCFFFHASVSACMPTLASCIHVCLNTCFCVRCTCYDLISLLNACKFVLLLFPLFRRSFLPPPSLSFSFLMLPSFVSRLYPGIHYHNPSPQTMCCIHTKHNIHTRP